MPPAGAGCASLVAVKTATWPPAAPPRGVPNWPAVKHSWFFFAQMGTPRTMDKLLLYDGGPLGLYNDNDATALKFTWYL